jgi:hypothetical protein
VPLDGPGVAERALALAAALAERAAGTVALLMVVSHSDHLARGRAPLERAATRLGDRDTKQDVVVGLPAATRLIEHLDRASVVVMSSHARRAVAGCRSGASPTRYCAGTRGPSCWLDRTSICRRRVPTITNWSPASTATTLLGGWRRSSRPAPRS